MELDEVPHSMLRDLVPLEGVDHLEKARVLYELVIGDVVLLGDVLHEEVFPVSLHIDSPVLLHE